MVAAVDWFGDATVFVVDVPLACCALESQAAAHGRARIPVDEVPEGAAVVVSLSGTLTPPMQPAVRHVMESVPESATVVSFGACACVGGPYWDSYAVVPGAEDWLRVDHFIAGCPPPPSALSDFLEGLRAEAAA